MEGWWRLLSAWIAGFTVVCLSPAAFKLATQESHPVQHSRIQAVKARVTESSWEGSPVEAVGPTYRISFALMVDDDIDGPRGWSFEKALTSYFTPFLNELSLLASFQVDSQVLYFSRLSRSHDSSEKGNNNIVTTKDLESFLSANNWAATSLGSSDREQVLHFMAFVPNRKDLVVQDSQGVNTSSFIIPRWGGVYILPLEAKSKRWILSSELEEAFAVFRSQLAHFLHVSSNPTLSSRDKTAWLLFYMRSAVETLSALDELLLKASEMTVCKRVSESVTTALDLIEFVEQNCMGNEMDMPDICLHNARKALVASEDAFFDPSLLPQLYFPPEHWVAVYVPYLLPALLPVLSGVVSTTSAKLWKKNSKQKAI